MQLACDIVDLAHNYKHCVTSFYFAFWFEWIGSYTGGFLKKIHVHTVPPSHTTWSVAALIEARFDGARPEPLDTDLCGLNELSRHESNSKWLSFSTHTDQLTSEVMLGG